MLNLWIRNWIRAEALSFYILFVSIFLFREIVKLNDENGLIEVVYGKAEDIDLPVKVDIIIR